MAGAVLARGGRTTVRGTPIGEFRHHWVHAYLATHGDVLAYVPMNVPDFINYWTGLREALYLMGAHPAGAGSRLVANYPIHPMMQAYLAQLGGAYQGIARGAHDVLNGYAAANPADVQRNLEPRPNERWANVGRGGNGGGIAHQQVDRLMNAHAALWAYEPTDPVDLENFFNSLPFAYLSMGEQVDANRTWAASYFPGAADIPGAFYVAWSNTYHYAAAEAVNVLNGYAVTSAADLERHHAPRTNEEKADVV